MKSKLDVIKAANPVLEIQFKLRDISQVESEIPIVLTTGIYDEQTKKSVIAFQKKYNLPVTGNVDFITWSELIKEHKNCMHQIDNPQKVCCFPSNMKEYRRGDSGNVIYVLQIVLKNYGKKFKNYSNVNLTGFFDEQTEVTLRQFQKYSNLPVTGVLDRRTWNVLNQIYEICNFCD